MRSSNLSHSKGNFNLTVTDKKINYHYPHGLLNISVPHGPMKPSQKFLTWTFKVTTNLSADKTVIKCRYMASVFVSEDELELVGLVRLKTISGKNQSSNGAVKDHIYAKHRMALEMDVPNILRKIIANFWPDRKCTTKIHERWYF